MLLALVEEMGHEDYEGLMEGAMGEEGDGPNQGIQGDVFLGAAAQAIKLSNRGSEEFSNGDEGTGEEEKQRIMVKVPMRMQIATRAGGWFVPVGIWNSSNRARRLG